MATSKRTLVALVEDRPGVLNRMASLCRRRGFNIESMTVGHSQTPNISRMTIVVDGSKAQVDQLRKQLDKLVVTVKVADITDDNIVVRELALIKVLATPATRSEIMQIVDIFRAGIVDVAADAVTVEVTGDEAKIDSLLSLLEDFGIREVTRTGRIAMTRGAAALDNGRKPAGRRKAPEAGRTR
jgi:acetolactate synthase-1/3 small subunit